MIQTSISFDSKTMLFCDVVVHVSSEGQVNITKWRQSKRSLRLESQMGGYFFIEQTRKVSVFYAFEKSFSDLEWLL